MKKAKRVPAKTGRRGNPAGTRRRQPAAEAPGTSVAQSLRTFALMEFRGLRGRERDEA